MKIKQIQAPQIRNTLQSSSISIRISGPIPEVKKEFALINHWENIIAYREKSKQSEALANKLVLFQIHLGGLGSGAAPGKFCKFYPHLN